jgi:hypothetical protein
MNARFRCVGGLPGAVLIAAGAAWAQSAASRPAGERYWKKDPVALRQEVDTFSSLRDGHPAAPGDWELQLDTGWLTSPRRSDSVPLVPTVKYTPHRYTESGYEFFEAMQLSLSMPLEMVDGSAPGSGDMNFGWQERWVAEHEGVPTLATLAEVRMPSGHESSGADGTFTGILDKDVGPGTLYLNGWARSANGDNTDDLRHFQWGLRAGYKWRIVERVALVADGAHQVSERGGRPDTNVLELGAECRTKHHLAFGPGILVGLDGHGDTPRFGAGFRVVYLFNARNPPRE